MNTSEETGSLAYNLSRDIHERGFKAGMGAAYATAAALVRIGDELHAIRKLIEARAKRENR